jgi:hypothetical protein
MLVGMRTSVSIAACLVLVGVMSSCSSQPGRRGVLEDDPLRVSFNVFTRGMLANKKPSNDYYSVRRGAYVRLGLQRSLVNEADHNVWVERCWGTALDADGHELFRIQPFAPRIAIEPGDSDIGAAMQPRITPPVQGDAISAVARYVADCEAYRWEGPLPPLEFS